MMTISNKEILSLFEGLTNDVSQNMLGEDFCVEDNSEISFHLKRAQRKILNEKIQSTFNSLSTHSKILMWVVYQIEKTKLKVITTREVYDELCKRLEISKKPPQRLRSLLNQLSMKELIGIKTKSLGRYGRITKTALFVI